MTCRTRSSRTAVEDLVYTPLRAERPLSRHDLEFYLAARTHAGAVGLHVVTPLELDDGRIVLVDRGWIPPQRRDPATRPEGQADGPVELVGLGRSSGWKGWDIMQPENHPEENLWFWVEPADMAAAAGLTGVIPGLYLDADASPNPGGLPIGGQTRNRAAQRPPAVRHHLVCLGRRPGGDLRRLPPAPRRRSGAVMTAYSQLEARFRPPLRPARGRRPAALGTCRP